MRQRLRLSMGMLAVAVFVGLLGWFSFPRPPPPEEPLRLGYTPAEESLTDRKEAQQTLAEYLSERLKRPVVLVQTASYGPAIEALEKGEIDIMALGPFAYLLAEEKGWVEAIAVTGTAAQGPRTYQSALIARRDSGLKNIPDLLSATPRLKLNLTDLASNSGYLVPKALLASYGVDVGSSFHEVSLTLSHSVAIYNVLFGRSDVAAVNAAVLQRLQNRGRIKQEELVTLWSSPLFPVGPMVVRRALPAELKRELQLALTELPEKDPRRSLVVMGQYADKGLVYLSCDDSLYAELRKLFARLHATTRTAPHD